MLCEIMHNNDMNDLEAAVNVFLMGVDGIKVKHVLATETGGEASTTTIIIFYEANIKEKKGS